MVDSKYLSSKGILLAAEFMNRNLEFRLSKNKKMDGGRISVRLAQPSDYIYAKQISEETERSA
ncbi:hypothetical protein QN344_05095, partial [Mucilaginibacter sp. 5B2]|nr:hypothetical protein [Mucilaginibacter sp. 5B2]